MSVIKEYKTKFFGGHLNVETYHSAQEIADDLLSRNRTDSRFKADEYNDRSFVGATRDETYRMLREGYQPVVDALKKKVRVGVVGKRFKRYDDVAGFQPIVPNAILGLPKSMINSSMMPMKQKVMDIYYEMTCSCSTDSDDLIKAGQKMLGVIMELEAKGYRFNLFVTQGYYDSNNGCDMLCLKVKNASQPMDLKRMSFPIAHTAFFRGLGFEWYSKFPKGTYRSGYGHAISYSHNQEEIQEEYRKHFGSNVIYFAAKTIIEKNDEAEDYIKEVLTAGEPMGKKPKKKKEEEPF